MDLVAVAMPAWAARRERMSTRRLRSGRAGSHRLGRRRVPVVAPTTTPGFDAVLVGSGRSRALGAALGPHFRRPFRPARHSPARVSASAVAP